MDNILNELGKKAKIAERILSVASTDTKNLCLINIANALLENKSEIIAANQIDIKNGKENGLSDAMLDRLSINEDRLIGIADGCRDVAALADPIGEIKFGTTRPNGLKITAESVPLGVIGIIYEARPNVTVDAAALCLKSGNTVILRGGKEAINTNTALVKIMRKALLKSDLPEDCVALVSDTSRESATALMNLQYLDVLIPRGGAGLINAVKNNSTVPVIETGTGNCHIFVDETADIKMASDIVFNAKCSRPSVCNAAETLLVHKNIAKKALPEIYALLKTKNVEFRGCEKTVAILGDVVTPATELDFETEFLDYVLAVKVVDSLDEAISHITEYSTGHSECIVTNSYENSELFKKSIDAAAVYVNASTRFTDGAMFGFGAEIGISTQKLHARGPMGLAHLTTIKYLVDGNGQIR